VPPEKLPGEEEGAEAIERANPGGSVKGKHHDCPSHGIEAIVVRIETPRDPAFEPDWHAGGQRSLHAKDRLRVVLL